MLQYLIMGYLLMALGTAIVMVGTRFKHRDKIIKNNYSIVKIMLTDTALAYLWPVYWYGFWKKKNVTKKN